MKREIKYRAWDIVLEKYIPWEELTQNNLFMSILHDKNYIMEEFTGLKDKNGKEIYEGGILKTSDSIGLVKHGKWVSHDVLDCGETEIWGWFLDEYCQSFAGTFYKSQKSLSEPHEYKIIGNINQNPELLDK